MSDSDDNSIDISEVDNKIKINKKEKISVTQEYINYHNKYVKKFGKDRTLVLMQVGSFYEAYATQDQGPDLKKLEELTEASIAHKGNDKYKVNIANPWMWGFPMVATLKFVGILIENGYRLIMIDQITPKPNITRAVVAIHSPATYLESAYKPTSNFVSVICIEEIKQKSGQLLSCIGMSAIDVSTGEVFVHESHAQFNDDKLGLDETHRFLKSLMPKEVLIFKENLQKISDEYMVEYLDLRGKFYQFREYNKNHLKIVYQKKILEKVYPDRENMTSIIDTLGLSQRIYARKALVNLLTYVSDHYEDLVIGVHEPIFYLNESNMILGNDAINQLDIVDNSISDIPGAVKFHNLLDVVNKASTGMGRRYIKFRLAAPYTDTDTLNNIYDISEIILKQKLNETLEKILHRIHDVERLYRKIKMHILHPMQMVEFISSFVAINELFHVIIKNKQLSSKIDVSEFSLPITNLNNLCNTTIDLEKAKLYNLAEIKENIFMRGIHPDLDKLQSKVGTNHTIMGELLEILNNLIPDVKNSSAKGKKLTLEHNKSDGYYFKLTIKRYESLKKALDKLGKIELEHTTINVSDFTVTKTKTMIKLSLPFLKKQTDNINEILEKIMNVTYTYYIEFMKTILDKYSDTLTNIINIVTKLDYYNTISHVAKEFNYVRPIIDDRQDGNGYLIAKHLRHPIVERIIDHEYIPHDIHIGTNNLNGMLIYGLNSAGKSVLMKAIGISVILAQSGFFVPAQQFTFYPYKALYTRITGNDNLFKGLSSYSLEIVELNSILKRSDKSTLVIGDEVCRGTEHISGNAIVATTLLRLSDIGSSFVFATHLHELMELEEISSKENIKSFHLSVEHDEESDRLIYDRTLKPGSGERIYGITVAKYIIKDEAFIKKAMEIKNRLIDKDPNSSTVSTKTSRYHSQLLMDRCEMCGKCANNTSNLSKKTLESHHINHQKDCENGFVKTKPHIRKNQIFNLAVLCEQCHDKIHKENIELEGIKMTSNGRKLIVKNKMLTSKLT
jgi:DNA mismatch repair protein MutS